MSSLEHLGVLSAVFILLCGLSLVMSRQMCYTCQYVQNSRGIECVTDPLKWKEGEIRLRCQGKCTILAEFDATTGEPTFFHRGCGVGEDQKNGCEDNGARHSCFYSCGGDGKNYCNDKSLPRSPLVDKKDENGEMSSIRASSTRVLVPIVFSVTVWIMVGEL